MSTPTLTPAHFPAEFAARMIAAYPVIARMTADQAYYASAAEKDSAFDRVLQSRNIGPICRQWWLDRTAGR